MTAKHERMLGPVTVAGGLALILVFRELYLLSFGADPCWMNGNFLLDVKAMRFAYPIAFSGMPLVRLLLFTLRDAGLGATEALGLIYLASHLLVALGLFSLAKTVLRDHSNTRPALALAIAILPAFSTDAGYRNISCTLAIGLFTPLAALLVARPWKQRRALQFGVAFVLAVAATTCRPESALSVAGLAIGLALVGSRAGTGRAGAVVAAGGLVTGFVLAHLSNRTTGTGGHLPTGVWTFYTFYETIPFAFRAALNIVHPGSTRTEYLRYAQASRWFGGYADNGGSLVRAVLHHPRIAALWLCAKPIDLLETIVLPDSFTPLAAVLVWLAVRRARAEGWRQAASVWTPMLVAFSAPLGFLVFWSQGHAPYLLFVAPFLLLAMLWGLEPILLTSRQQTLRLAGFGLVVAAGLFVVVAGHPSPSSSPVMRRTAEWLERHCAGSGCLVNALPESLDGMVWADLQAGARLPPKDKRTEEFVMHRYSRQYLDEVSFGGRVARARAAGWRGPIYYVRTTIKSIGAFNDDFDPEHRLEGIPNLLESKEVAEFRDDKDTIEIFALPTTS
ncbi:MAG TPA: hypothetical protein VGP07_05065 [Polyangia bacterium]|jgi:hypothetical protein